MLPSHKSVSFCGPGVKAGAFTYNKIELIEEIPSDTDMDPIRILTAVPICDGHDSAINTINLELIRHGIEVIYLGYHRSARDIVRAAIQEDVRAIGISTYNGGHVEFFA